MHISTITNITVCSKTRFISALVFLISISTVQHYFLNYLQIQLSVYFPKDDP